MIKELLSKIAEVTDKYATLECIFSTNTLGGNDEPKENKKIPRVKWVLYIADTTQKSGSSFPEFSTFEQLSSYVEILCLELKRVNQDAVKNAVEIATTLFEKEKLIKGDQQ